LPADLRRAGGFEVTPSLATTLACSLDAVAVLAGGLVRSIAWCTPASRASIEPGTPKYAETKDAKRIQTRRTTRQRELGRHSTQSNDNSRRRNPGDIVAPGSGSGDRRFSGLLVKRGFFYQGPTCSVSRL